MKIFVTGATGFIGSQLVKELVSSRFEVVSLGRKAYEMLPAIKKEKLKGSTYLQIDMDEIEKLPKIISKNGISVQNDSVFFNLAWGGEKLLSDLNVKHQFRNVVRSENAMIAAKKIGIKKFIHVGTMEEAFAKKYFTEKHRSNNLYNRHLIYACAKLLSNKSLKIKAKEIGMDYIYTSHSHVMGPWDSKDSILQVTINNIIDEKDMKFSTGEQLWDAVSVYDCARGFKEIIKSGKCGSEYWVGSGNPRSLKEYLEELFEIFEPRTKVEFGVMPFNDVLLEKEDFNIRKLEQDTAYKVEDSFKKSAIELHEHLKEIKN